MKKELRQIRPILIRDLFVVGGFALLLFFSGRAQAVTTDKARYFFQEPVVVSSTPASLNTLYLFDKNLGLDVCSTSQEELDRVGGLAVQCAPDAVNLPVGDYSLLEFNNPNGNCSGIGYEACKALPDVIGETLFSIALPPPPPPVTGNGAIPAYRPEVSILSPGRDQSFSNKVTIKYEATDQNDAFQKEQFGLSNKPVSIYYSESSDTRQRKLIEAGLPPVGTYVWDAKDLPEDETYVITVEVVDNNKEVGTADSPEFSLDHTLPFFAVHALPAITTGEDVHLTVEATKDLVSPPTVFVEQNLNQKVEVKMTGTGTTYEGVYTVIRGYDGPAKITLSGTDLSGNVSSTIVSGSQFNVGIRPPPDPIVTTPLDRSIASSTAIVVRGNVRPDTEAILSLNGAVIATTKPDREGNFVFENIKLSATFSAGTNFLAVVSKDLIGHSSQPATVTVKLNLAPEIRVISPVEGQIVATSTLIVVSASDKNKDKLTYTYEVTADAGVTWTLIAENSVDKKVLWKTDSTPDGEYRVRVTASDGFTRTIATSPVFIIRNLSSSILFDGGIRTVTNERTYAVAGRASVSPESPSQRIVHIEYSVNGGKEWADVAPLDDAFDSKEERFRIGFENQSEGVHTIQVRVKDDRGVYGAGIKTIVVDFGPPPTPIVSAPLTGSFVSDADDEDKKTAGVQITMRGTAEPDALVEISSSDGVVTTQATKQGTFAAAGVTLLRHGEVAFSVLAKDSALNKSPVGSVTYSYNNPPTLSFIAPRTGRGVSGKTIIQFDAHDKDLDTLKNLLLSYAPSITEPFVTLAREPKEQSFVWDVSEKKDSGGAVLRLEASDGLEKSVTTNVISIDNTAPTVSVEPLSTKVYKKDFVLEARGKASDNLSGVEFVEYTIDGEHWFKATITRGYIEKAAAFRVRHPLALVDGVYDFGIRSVDAAGNLSPVSIQKIVVDTTGPRVGGFELTYGSLTLLPEEQMFEIPGRINIDLAVSLESDAKTAMLHVGTSTYPLVFDGAHSLWRATFETPENGKAQLLIDAQDVNGNRTNGKEVAAIKVTSLGLVTESAAEISTNAPLLFDRALLSSTTPQLPVEDALVSILTWSEDAQTFIPWSAYSYGLDNPLRSQKDGSFVLALPAGRYQLSVQKTGFARLKTEEFILSRAQFVSPVLEIKRRVGLRGELEDFLDSVSLF